MPLNSSQFRFIKSRVRTGGRILTRGEQPLPTPAQSQGSKRPRIWQEGEATVDEAFRAGIGTDAYPLPMIQHEEGDVAIADFAAALFALQPGVPVLQLQLAPGIACDKFEAEWEFTVPGQQDALAVFIFVNGRPFIDPLWNRQYNSRIELFQKIDTQSVISMNLVLKAGAVLVPPLGRFRPRIIAYGYRGTYVG